MKRIYIYIYIYKLELKSNKLRFPSILQVGMSEPNTLFKF